MIDRLAAWGVTPNQLSRAGLLFAIAAAGCFALGAGHTLPIEASGGPSSLWPAAAALCLGASAVADVADGSLARRRGLASSYGALLDSTLDRFADMAISIGCAIHFAAIGNATFSLIAMLTLVASVQVSYVKARGENLTEGLGVGFWQRGERVATLITAALLGRVPAALCVLATLPLFTVALRMQEARRRLGAAAASRATSLPWRAPRGSLPYLGTCLGIAALMLVAPWLDPFFAGAHDPLGDALRVYAAR